MSGVPSPTKPAQGARVERTGLVFFVGGAALAWFFVAHGFSAAWSVSLPLAALAATVTVGIQIAVLLKYKRYGRKLGTALWSLYCAFMGLNLVLAAAGVAATVLEDRLGQTSIGTELTEQQAQISAVADSLAGVAGEADRTADASKQKQQSEATSGGSCTFPGQAPSPKGDGPIARMRESDRALFASLAQDSNNLAAKMRSANVQVEQAIAEYSAANHKQTIATVRAAIDEARASAAASQNIRKTAEARLAQWRAGTPVACNDPEFERRIEALASAEFPTVSNVGALPSAPSPGSAADNLIAALIALVFDFEPLDLQLWGMPIFFGSIPDIMLMIGFGMWTFDRRAAVPIIHHVTQGVLGEAMDWTSFQAAAANGLVEQGLASLGRYHARKTSHFGDTDMLMIPAEDEEARPFLMMAKALAAQGWARYQGVAPASALPKSVSPRPDVTDETPCEFFVLGQGVWDRIMMEAVRMAAKRAGEPA